jgi:hypothetical protein
MRFILMIKGDHERGEQPDPQLVAEISAFHEELLRAGLLLEAGALRPSAAGAKIRVVDGELAVIDGPFADPLGVVHDYAVIQAHSREEAIELGSRLMRIHLRVHGPACVHECEIRQMCGPGGL